MVKIVQGEHGGVNAARVRDDVGTSTASAGRMPQGGASSGSVAAARTAAALAGAPFAFDLVLDVDKARAL